MNPPLKFVFLAGADRDVRPPSYETVGAAGADIRANLAKSDRANGLILRPGARVLVPSGLAFEIPAGFEGQVRPRSGLALKFGVTVANAPGTIDSDYRGPVRVLLVNLGCETFIVSHGERIAQLVVAPVVQARFFEARKLDQTARGDGGFGSTGQV